MFIYVEEEICGIRLGFEQICSVFEICVWLFNSLNYDVIYIFVLIFMVMFYESYGGLYFWLFFLFQLLVFFYYFSFVEIKIE